MKKRIVIKENNMRTLSVDGVKQTFHYPVKKIILANKKEGREIALVSLGETSKTLIEKVLSIYERTLGTEKKPSFTWMKSKKEDGEFIIFGDLSKALDYLCNNDCISEYTKATCEAKLKKLTHQLEEGADKKEQTHCCVLY